MIIIRLVYAFILHSCVLESSHFILIAPPGSGKGTFSQYMKAKYGYVQICPGDIFRKEILLETPLGKKIKPIVESGEYVDEDTTCSLMKKYMQEALEQNKLFILDGFPRSQDSLQYLMIFLKEHNLLDKVIFLELRASDQMCKKRILGRYVCNACGYVDNVSMLDVDQCYVCKNCQAVLTRRLGDQDEIVDKRLRHFHQTIKPLLDQIQNSTLLFRVINTDQDLLNLQKVYDDLLF